MIADKEQDKEKETLAAAADSLTDKPDIVAVPRIGRGRLHRWLMQKGWLPRTRTYTVRQLRYANCLRISKALLDLPTGAVLLGSDQTQREIMQLMSAHGETLVRVAAICLTNPRQEPAPALLETIRQEFTSRELLAICRLAVKRLHPQDFMHSIILIGGLDILRQRTKAEEMSLYTGEIIAPGDS